MAVFLHTVNADGSTVLLPVGVRHARKWLQPDIGGELAAAEEAFRF